MNYIPAFPKPSQRERRVTLTPTQKREQLDRKCIEQEMLCAYCLRRMTRNGGSLLTACREHIVCGKMGGCKDDSDSNIVAACAECNGKKGSRRDWRPQIMPFPKTIEEAKQQGYKYVEHRACKGATCHAVIELWETPRGKTMPFNVDDKTGAISAHWATCPDHEDFRR